MTARKVVALVVLFLLASVSPALAAPQTARGLFVFDPRMGGTDAINVATQAGEDAVSVALDDWNAVTPAVLEPYLDRPIWHVYLRTAGGENGYDPDWVASHFEGNGWAALMTRHPEVEWVLQVGNEPSVDLPLDAWHARSLMISAYRSLAVDRGWRDKYPELRWAVAVGTDYDSMLVHVQWTAEDGGVRDYYDAVVVHVYGENRLDDNAGGPRSYDVYHYLMRDSFTRAVLVTEMGIHAPNRSTDDKIVAYRNWINSQPAKLRGATPFVAGYSDAWPFYAVTTYDQGTTLGDHWTGN